MKNKNPKGYLKSLRMLIDPQAIKATAVIVLAILIVGGLVLLMGNVQMRNQMEQVSKDLIIRRVSENADLASRNLANYKQLIYALSDDNTLKKPRNWRYYQASEQISQFFRASERISATITYDLNILNIYACYPSQDLVFANAIYKMSGYHTLSQAEQMKLQAYKITPLLETLVTEGGMRISNLKLAALIGQNANSGDYIVMELMPEMIIDILTTTNEMGSESIALFDQDGHILFSNSGIVPEEWYEILAKESKQGFVDIRSEKYFYTGVTINAVGWQYLMAVPQSNLIDNSGTNTGAIIILFMIVLLALALGVFVAQWVFQPIEQLFNRVLDKSLSPMHRNRIDYLSRIFDRLIGENKDLKEIADRNLPLIREKVLMQIVMQQGLWTISPGNLSDLGLSFSSHMNIIIMTYYDNTDHEKEVSIVYNEIVREFWQDKLPELGDCHVVFFLPNYFFILINQRESGLLPDQLEHWFQQHIDQYNQTFHGIITGGISSAKSDITDLGSAFREAQYALDRQLLVGPGYVSSYREFIVSNPILTRFPIDLTEKLIHGIMNTDRSIIDNVSKKIHAEIMEASPEDKFVVKQYFSYIIIMIFQQISEKAAGINLECVYKKYMTTLVSIHDLAGYLDVLKNFIHDIGISYQHYLKDQQRIQAFKIRDYIQTHYQEPLSHETIAKAFQISVPYLYKLLKEELNITPGNYLNVVRSNEAAKLLKNSDMMVRMIGIHCGYDTERSFFRNFKKTYGCSPSQFREK